MGLDTIMENGKEIYTLGTPYPGVLVSLLENLRQL